MQQDLGEKATNWIGEVREILVAASPTSEMVRLPKVRALPGRGLEGDRYFLGNGTFSPNPQKPDFELTLIEQENIEAFAAQSSLPFTSSHARRTDSSSPSLRNRTTSPPRARRGFGTAGGSEHHPLRAEYRSVASSRRRACQRVRGASPRAWR